MSEEAKFEVKDNHVLMGRAYATVQDGKLVGVWEYDSDRVPKRIAFRADGGRDVFLEPDEIALFAPQAGDHIFLRPTVKYQTTVVERPFWQRVRGAFKR